MVISKYNDVRAQIQEQISESSVSDASSRTCSQMPLDLPRKLPPAPGQPCGQIEGPESPASCCSRLPVVFSYLCTSGRLVSAPLLSGCQLWISATTLHLRFTSHLSQVVLSWSCSPTFLCLFFSTWAVPVLMPPSPPLSRPSLLFSLSHSKTNICPDCIAHATHFLYHFPLQYLYCLPHL